MCHFHRSRSTRVWEMYRLLNRRYSPGNRFRGGLSFIVFVVVFLMPHPADSHDDALATWATAALEYAEDYRVKPIATTIDDHFDHYLIAGGQVAETACSGTSWVYDHRHHIAAGRDRGTGPIQMLLYAKDPPTTMPDRDLSSVKSDLGLHLGMAASEVARLYRVSSHAIVQLPSHRRVLYLDKLVKCGDQACGHDIVVVFENARVVSISLHDHGP
jgi:hypothetical protein